MADIKVDNLNQKGTPGAYAGLPQVQGIPSNLRAAGIMSDTSSAPECFINQRFSAKLQAYLIGYVSTSYSNYSIYAE